jgi:hypothetical protein
MSAYFLNSMLDLQAKRTRNHPNYKDLTNYGSLLNDLFCLENVRDLALPLDSWDNHSIYQYQVMPVWPAYSRRATA